MAESGQRITGTDATVTFLETTAGTRGERVVVEIAYAGTGNRPPTHYHPSQEERFEVLEGEINAVVGGSERTLRPGEELVIPPGTEHAMWSDPPSRQVWETRPALKTERFFETVWGLQQDGRTGRNGLPSPLQMALTLRHFSDEIRLTSPPALVQAIAFPTLALIARARGLGPEYSPARA